MRRKHDYTRCKCLHCLEAWLYYGNPPPCDFKVRQKVRVLHPKTRRARFRGTIYRLDYDLEWRQWVATVKVTSGRRGLALCRDLILDKPAKV